MTDTIANQSSAPAEDTRTQNKRLIFAALAELGIHSVTVEYDGSSDSGQIESIEAWDAAHNRIPLPTSRRLQLLSDSSDQPPTEMNIEAAIETLAYEYLEDRHPGWENNDGAYGTFVFDVPEQTIALEHRARFTDADIFTHEF
jgi:Family of unknown function (DUF6878)